MAEAAKCPRCGEPVPARSGGRGRPSRWCSDACRKAGHRAAKAPAGPKAPSADERRGAVLELLARAALPNGLAAAVEGADEDLLARFERELKAVASVSVRLGRLLPAPAAAELPAPAALVQQRPPAPVREEVPLPPEPEPEEFPPPPEQARYFEPEPAAPRTYVAPQRTATKTRAVRSGPLRPTAEQHAIIEACRTGKNTVIEAGAGTGKTSTLRMIATELGRSRGLYLAFNKPIAVDAQRSFPGNVTARTAHSVAFNSVGRQYKARLDAPKLSAAASAQILGLDITMSLECGSALLTAPVLAHHALETVKRYCQSDADEILTRHVPKLPGVDEPEDRDMLVTLVLPIAKRAWADIREIEGRLKFEHDHYFKIWALARPRLPYDFICLDEAQDTNPVLAKVVYDQPIQQIVVGDSNQAIYGWRGAVDALANWPASHRLQLTKSWRFGPQLADEANKWLKVLGSGMRLTGNSAVRTHIGDIGVDFADAVVCRTNAETIHQAIAALAAGRRTALVGGTRAIEDMARAAQALQDGKATEHPELAMFESWDAVKEYAKTDAASADLRVLVRLVEKHGTSGIRKITRQFVDERDAEVRISTAHKAKGREWDSVMIGGDFFEPKAQPGTPGAVDRDEARLSYVSITRAKRSLDRGSLEWIDDYVPGAAPRQGGHDRPLALDW
jgi:UvrD-like helicase family protein